MIGRLNGMIVDKTQPGKLVIDVNGVGYDVETSLQTFFQLELEPQKRPVSLHIHTVVREDALLLYGFLGLDERALFRALIKVNGVGPKLAITILSSISPDEFIQCINHQDADRLTKLPGIGKKTAERLVVEMKDSLKDMSTGSVVAPEMNSSAYHAESEAVKALEALGYKNQEAIKAVKKVDDGNQSCEQLIRLALQVLSGR